jgi:hypothetical protein
MEEAHTRAQMKRALLVVVDVRRTAASFEKDCVVTFTRENNIKCISCIYYVSRVSCVLNIGRHSVDSKCVAAD